MLVLGTQAAQPSADELQSWLTYYYLKPRPELLLPSLAVMDRELQRGKGRSLSDQVRRGGMRTFYAKVLAQNDKIVDEVERQLPTLPAGQQEFITEALRRCGTKACLRALNSDIPLVSDMDQITAPTDLDDRWGAFFATGDARYVREIMEVLDFAEDKRDPTVLVVAGAARWSLTSNAYQHKRVLAICEEGARASKGARKLILDEIISRAKVERAKKPPNEPESTRMN
jgi:hypothetical protein